MSDDYQPKHAAPFDWDRNYDANLAAKRYRGQRRTNPAELTVTRYTGHGIGHTYRADFRIVPL